ncbi:hypothetical protein E4U17_006491 [Claviceps sp. LM77 group G4]|nr:hypothetical protein E4U17_006491 [Claviceps sp. LM77 group G4]KAG6051497.1 hypothetical protein E4U33_000610 [Claviceps sp. LM78 group G4]
MATVSIRSDTKSNAASLAHSLDHMNTEHICCPFGRFVTSRDFDLRPSLIRDLTEKLGTVDGGGAHEASRFQMPKEKFTQNVEGLKRLKILVSCEDRISLPIRPKASREDAELTTFVRHWSICAQEGVSGLMGARTKITQAKS